MPPRHTPRSRRSRRLEGPRRPGGARVRSSLVSGALCAAVLALAGCDDNGGTDPGSLRFGQIGEVQLRLEVPLRLGEGFLEQSLSWSSEGRYRLEERISYLEMEGDRTVSRSTQNPEVLAGTYAQWITQVNEVPSLSLFVDRLDPTLEPECGQARTRLTLTIRDEPRGETVAWTRCADGSLGFLVPRNAGPDPEAARVVNAATLLRDVTLGEGFISTYQGSVPFYTLAKGEDSGAKLEDGRAITTAAQWQNFWSLHTQSDEEPPEIDFEERIVLVGGVGVRNEAGDSVEIRRVLPTDGRSVVELFERVPGDFCSPAAKVHTPFHIVVAPTVPLPVEFTQVRVERVPCGQ